MGLHFLSFWPFRGRLLGPPPQVAKNGPFAQRPYNGIISAVTGPILQFLAFWAFISLHFGLVGLHFLAFWPFRGQLLGPPPQVAKNGPFAQRPYNRFIRAVTGSILQFLAFWAFISLHFGLVGRHFLAFWPCGPSFPCILALWAFFLAFWPCGPSFPFILALWAFISFILALWAFISILAFSGSASGSPLQVAKNGPFAQRPYNGFSSAVTGFILQFLTFWAFISLHFGLVGLHFLAFWPCGPSFPCILALWAFISLHFGLVGLHFLSFWHFRGRHFPIFGAFISFYFCLLGLHLAFGSTLVKATLVSIYMCMQVCIMSVQFQRFTCIQNCANKNWRPISPDPGQRKPTPLRNPRSTPKKVKKLKQVFSIIIARACSTLVKAILLRMYARMCV